MTNNVPPDEIFCGDDENYYQVLCIACHAIIKKEELTDVDSIRWPLCIECMVDPQTALDRKRKILKDQTEAHEKNLCKFNPEPFGFYHQPDETKTKCCYCGRLLPNDK